MASLSSSPFEALFVKYGGVSAIPVAYLRALAYRESGFRPDVVHPSSRATGLFQITKVALDTYNRRNRTAHALEQLKDPELNTRVAAQHLVSVIGAYRRHRSLQPDWQSRRWVELLTLGWNAGHNAIARLVAKMEASRIPLERITVDSVRQLAAASAGTGKYVAEPGRVAWSKSVAELFLRGDGGSPGGGQAAASPSGGVLAQGARTGLAVLAVVAAGAVVAFAAQKGGAHGRLRASRA